MSLRFQWSTSSCCLAQTSFDIDPSTALVYHLGVTQHAKVRAGLDQIQQNFFNHFQPTYPFLGFSLLFSGGKTHVFSKFPHLGSRSPGSLQFATTKFRTHSKTG